MKQNLFFIYFLNLFLFTPIHSQLMRTYEYYTDLWQQDMIPLEYPAYHLLKKNPILTNVNYLAIPWAYLIDTNRLDLVPKIKLNGGFTITRSVHFEKLFPILSEIGINVIFTPHATLKEYKSIKVLPMPHFNLNGTLPNKNKDIFYSFIGCEDNPLRKKIFRAKHSKKAVIIKRKTLHFYIDIWEKSQEAKIRKEQEKIEYQNILSRSRFSLCPNGRGPGTLRFWESLQAGAIPVLIECNLALPSGFDWESCIVKISEIDINNISEILTSISQDQEAKMRKKCLRAHKLFSNNNLIKVIKNYYENNIITN
ncbi:MAG: exostosin family protein [Candidatus Babeliales bacterium]|nr:exostosin family protein [Candidatus Babeliales bacterium]